MAGSEESNEELVSGRVNHAEDTTSFWAQCHENGDDFNGNEVVNVSIQEHIDHDNLKEEGINTMPTNPISGIYSEGFLSGTGVIARGGNENGTGVLGKGGGAPRAIERGFGGIGVHGIGGSMDLLNFPSNDFTPAGAGVVAQGGIDDNTHNFKHGAGVIGIAGGSTKPLPPHTDTGSVGIYGQGADTKIRTIPNPNGDGTQITLGPPEPGPGILGRGGTANIRMPDAAGVIGLAGNRAIPLHSVTGDNGVYGEGPTGVAGTGDTGVRGIGTGPGIDGSSSESRGGIFHSDKHAQVQLIPNRVDTTFPETNTVTPKGVVSPEGRIQDVLPKDGFGGDLMSISDKNGKCTLWFCVKGVEKGSDASWAQVLLGVSFTGKK